MTFWFGTTAAEVDRAITANPSGDLQQHFPKTGFHDVENCQCPQGCDRVLLSARFGPVYQQARRRIYDFRRDPHVPHLILVETAERFQVIHARIRCADPAKKVGSHFRGDFENDRVVERIRAQLARRLPVSRMVKKKRSRRRSTKHRS